jgi:hypothetical protein
MGTAEKQSPQCREVPQSEIVPARGLLKIARRFNGGSGRSNGPSPRMGTAEKQRHFNAAAHCNLI